MSSMLSLINYTMKLAIHWNFVTCIWYRLGSKAICTCMLGTRISNAIVFYFLMAKFELCSWYIYVSKNLQLLRTVLFADQIICRWPFVSLKVFKHVLKRWFDLTPYLKLCTILLKFIQKTGVYHKTITICKTNVIIYSHFLKLSYWFSTHIQFNNFNFLKT